MDRIFSPSVNRMPGCIMISIVHHAVDSLLENWKADHWEGSWAAKAPHEWHYWLPSVCSQALRALEHPNAADEQKIWQPSFPVTADLHCHYAHNLPGWIRGRKSFLICKEWSIVWRRSGGTIYHWNGKLGCLLLVVPPRRWVSRSIRIDLFFGEDLESSWSIIGNLD